MKKLSLFLFLVIIKSLSTCIAQGSLDYTFGDKGVVLTEIKQDAYEAANAVAIQKDGRIVVAGNFTRSNGDGFIVVRYNTDGSLDNNFGIGGKLITKIGIYENSAAGVVIQDDGKIVVVGSVERKLALLNITEAFIVRYNSNGTIDSSFSDDGIATISAGINDVAAAVLIQPDSKILIAGSSDNGKDYDFLIARYNTDGKLDKSFSNDGKMTFDNNDHEAANAICLQPDGKIIIAGQSSSYFGLARFLPNGNVDDSFGQNGTVGTDLYYKHSAAFSVAVQNDGKIIAGGDSYRGWSNDFGLVRYNQDGSLDKSFGTKGIVMTQIYYDDYDAGIRSIIIQPDGKILAAGFAENDQIAALVRYEIDGSVDTSFGVQGIVKTNFYKWWNCGIEAMAMQSDGKVIAVGFSSGEHNDNDNDIALARYITDLKMGLLDFTTTINQILIYPNPINKEVTIEYSLNKTENISIQLYDIEGRILKTFIPSHFAVEGNYKQLLELPEELAAGLYYITISSGNGSYSLKVIKP